MSTQEPMTEAGKALLAGLAYPYGTRSIPMHIGQPARSRQIVHDAVARALPAIESAARAIGAQQERRRLVAKAKLDHHTKRDHPDHRHPWGYCENARCRDRYGLLSDPQPDAPVAEQADV